MQNHYIRNFITLKQERTDCTAKDREALGTCILEVRGHIAKINASILHLKPDHFYKLCLVAATENAALCVHIGNFVQKGTSKFEARCEFNATNVSGSNIPIENFNVIIVTSGKHSPDVIIPLSGYINKPVLWKNKLSFFDRDKVNSYSEAAEKDDEPEMAIKGTDSIENKEITARIFEEASTEIFKEAFGEATEGLNIISLKQPTFEIDDSTPYEKDMTVLDAPEIVALEEAVIGPVIDIKSDYSEHESNEKYATEKDFFDTLFFNEWAETKNPAQELSGSGEENLQQGKEEAFEDSAGKEIDFHETFKQMAKKFNQEVEELNQYTIMSEEELDNIYLYEREKKAVPETFNFYQPKQESNEYEIRRIFLENAKMHPFQSQKKDVVWVRIGIDELSVLPIDFVKYVNSSFVASKYYKYKHLLLGKINASEQNRFILGVPDSYDQAYKPIAAELEFRQFKPCDGKPITEGVMGYWLMII